MHRSRLISDLIKWILLFGAWLATAGVVRATGEKLPLLKVGSEFYTNVVVTDVTVTHIYFSHSRGMANAKLKSLEPEAQKMFHFDSAKAAVKEQEQAESNARYREAVQRAKPPPRPSTELTEAADPQLGPGADIPPHAVSARSFLNQPAPLIVADKWLTPQPDLNGKFILLDFWATWCGPCRKSIPQLNALASKFKDRLVVIGLSDESEEDVRKLTNPAIEYSIAIDTQHRSSSAVGVTAIPHALLVDQKGIVRFEGHPSYLEEDKLEKLMATYGE